MSKYLASTIYLIALILASYSNWRVFKSYQEQLPLLADFNFRQANLGLSTEVIEGFQDYYPNLNSLSIPIKILKANYYVRDQNIEKALKYSNDGNKFNPYLFLSEFQKGRLYLNLNQIDSAYYYLNKAAKGLPKNQSHLTYLQLALGQLEKQEELDSLFELKKNFAEEAFWQNQFFLLSKIKLKKSIAFTSNDSLNVEEAIKKYPKNKIIRVAHQAITLNLNSILSANLFDSEANISFENKDYDEAIKLWKKAIEVIPNDQAYYFNIARSLTLQKKYKSSDSLLKSIIGKGFLVDNGEKEFLMAMNYIDDIDNYRFKVCNLLKTSKEKGFETASNIYKQLDEQVGCN